MSIHLVRANDDFEIYSPIIMNSEVIAYKDNIDNVHKIGIGHKREHLHKLVMEKYKQVEVIIEMSTISLPYSLEGGHIEGAVLDVTKAAILPKFDFVPLSTNDYISYSLVVRKDIVDTKAFKDFLTAYNEVVVELNQRKILIQLIGMTEEFWDDTKIKFLSLE